MVVCYENMMFSNNASLSPEATEVETVIRTLYNPISNQAEREQAIQWLDSFSKSHLAWKPVICLITSSNDSQVQFFCANVLYTKLQSEWLSQTDEFKTELHGNILGIIQKYVHSIDTEPLNLSKSALQRLCLCLAIIALLSPAIIDSYIEEAFKVLELWAKYESADHRLAESFPQTNTSTLAASNSQANAAQKALFVGTELLICLPDAKNGPDAETGLFNASVEPGSIGEKLQLLLPRILEAFSNFFQFNKPEANVRLFQVIAAWAKFGITLATLKNFEMIFRTLVESVYSEDANILGTSCDAMTKVINTKSPSFMLTGELSDEDKSAAGTIMSSFLTNSKWKLEQCIQKGSAGDEIAQSLCGVISTFGETYCDIIVEGSTSSTLEFADLMLSFVGYPTRSVALTALDFWLSVQDIPMEQRDRSMREPRFMQLLQVLAGQCTIPIDVLDPDDIDEEIINFRKYAKDLLISVFIALKSDYFKKLLGALDEASRSQQWNLFEVALFSLQAVSSEASSMIKESTTAGPHAAILRELVITLISQLAANPLFGSNAIVLITGINVISSYSKLVPTSQIYNSFDKASPNQTDLLEQALQCVLRGLGTPQAHKAAATGIKSIAIACTKEIRNRPNVITHLISTLESTVESGMEIEARLEIVQGITRVISGIDPADLRLNLLTSLMKPGILRLQTSMNTFGTAGADQLRLTAVINDELNAIHTTIQFTDTSGRSNPGDDPISKLLEEIWPIIISVSSNQQVMQNPDILTTIYKFISAIILSVPQVTVNHIESILNASVTQFESSLSPCCLECVGRAVEVYAKTSENSEIFPRLLGAYSERIVIAVKNRESIDPEIVEKYFDMLYRYLLFSSNVLFTSTYFPAILEVAAYFVTIQESGPARMVLTFLENILKKTHPETAGNAPRLPYAPQVDAAIQVHGFVLVTQIFTGLATTSPSVHYPRLSNLYYQLVKNYRASIEAWSFNSLRGIQALTNKFSEDNTRQFVLLITASNVEKNRLDSILTDFAKICRGEKSMESLNAYFEQTF